MSVLLGPRLVEAELRSDVIERALVDLLDRAAELRDRRVAGDDPHQEKMTIVLRKRSAMLVPSTFDDEHQPSCNQTRRGGDPFWVAATPGGATEPSPPRGARCPARPPTRS